MTDKHTPGPWRIERTPYGYQIHAGHACQVQHVAEMGCDGEPLTGCEEANACLIAACPTMHDYVEKRAAEGCQEATAILEAIHDL